MSWARFSDTFNDHKVWMWAAELAATRGDESLVIKLKGVTTALFISSAVAWTDYEVTKGMVIQTVGIAGHQEVINDLIAIGVLTPKLPHGQSDDGDVKTYMLLDDVNFVHLIRSDDKKKADKRKNDRRKASLVVPVLFRDGDQCRYCGVDVVWGDTRSDRGQTFDHRDIDSPTTPATFVVACSACNEGRAASVNPDEEFPLLDPPVQPVYGPGLVEQLSKWPSVTSRVARKLNVPNPLDDKKDCALIEDSPRNHAWETPHTKKVTTRRKKADHESPSRSQRFNMVASDPDKDRGESGRQANGRQRRAGKTQRKTNSDGGPRMGSVKPRRGVGSAGGGNTTAVNPRNLGNTHGGRAYGRTQQTSMSERKRR
jgi:hypothetical protein|nr:MAG TPA: HNH endonuclease [Caudoviricetes sp.]